MHADTLTNLFFEEFQDVRNVEHQIVDALTRIGKGVSVKGLSDTVTRILTTTKQRMERLNRIVDEIEPVHESQTVFCPAIAERMRSALEQTAPRTRGIFSANRPRLTPREIAVLRLIAEGYANKQIAAEFGISIKTVEKHRQRMMAKLDLHDTAGVTRYAISTGLVQAIA